MTTPRGRGGHHLYYSSHADPMENMLRAHTLKVLIMIIMIIIIMIIIIIILPSRARAPTTSTSSSGPRCRDQGRPATTSLAAGEDTRGS